MNVIIWLQNAGGGIGSLNPAVVTLKRLYGEVNIIGAITPKGFNINGVKTIDKQDLKTLEYDLILVAGKDASIAEVMKEADIDGDKIVLDRTVCIPLFALDKYKKLRHSQLSILSMNCFAGLVYHRFGLPFLTPTINMFTSEIDFLKLLVNPIHTMHKELIFQRMNNNPNLKIDYPIYKIGDTLWYMNHYSNVDLAFRKWYERTYRINWYNLLVTMYTDKPEILAEFDKLPFAKKVCFVSFKTDLDSGFYIDTKGDELWQFVNGTAMGAFVNYDFWDMLLYGKKTAIIQQ